MSLRRVVALYGVLVGLFVVVLCRLFVVAQNQTYAGRASAQTVTTLSLGEARGDFYDRNGEKLTGRQDAWYALCVPGEESYARLFDHVDEAGQRTLYQKRNAATPFLVQVDGDLRSEGIFTVRQARRYGALPVCTHLLGYLDGSGHGVSGLEAAFDELLAGAGEESYVQCVTNAQGALMENTSPAFYAAQGGGQDVQLTIDAAVQTACEGIAQGMMTTGSILVLQVDTAQVLASVSMPCYQPDNVQKSIAAGDGALLDRTLAAYAVGSVFKPVLAAAAVEEGLTGGQLDCVGYVQVSDHIYRCAGGVPHGVVGLAEALEKSCNCYFIQLGHQLGAATLYRYAEAFGFGQPVYLAGGLKAAAGNLPAADQLADLGQLSNFSFGQGALLATPVQVAGMMNALAADGVYRTPSFLLRTFSAQSGQTLAELYAPQTRQVVSRQTARTLQTMLAGVVADGLGQEAQPTWGEAAGKTGTAQTGRFAESGEEYKNLWFAGFWPVQQPQYTIVVLQDDQTQAAYSSAAVFARVCDALALLNEEETFLPAAAEKS